MAKRVIGVVSDLTGSQKGANDELFGSLLFGDATNSFSDNARGGNDTLHGTGSPSEFVAIYGDTFSMIDSSRGGNDSIFGADFLTSGVNDLFGDARTISNNAQGGNDYLKGGDFGNINNIFGDAWSLIGTSTGGNDALQGGNYGGLNILYGDAQSISDDATGGNDTIVAGEGTTYNIVYGDAEVLFGKGGNDFLSGSTNSTENILYGDAYEMRPGSVAGDDVLKAGDGTHINTLYGDARFAYGDIVCGNDVLISSNGVVDHLWGDTQLVTDGQQISGIDAFVFAPGNGQDVIHDFEVGKDFLDLRAFEFASIDDIQFTHDAAGDLRIEFADGRITFTGVSELQISHDILI